MIGDFGAIARLDLLLVATTIAERGHTLVTSRHKPKVVEDPRPFIDHTNHVPKISLFTMAALARIDQREPVTERTG